MKLTDKEHNVWCGITDLSDSEWSAYERLATQGTIRDILDYAALGGVKLTDLQAGRILAILYGEYPQLLRIKQKQEANAELRAEEDREKSRWEV